MEKSRKEEIRLSDHFTYGKLLRFVLPSIIMMVFTSIYGVVDGLFVSNFAGKESFAAINLVMPFIMVLGGMGFMIGTGGTALVSKIMGQGDILHDDMGYGHAGRCSDGFGTCFYGANGAVSGRR